MFSPTEMKLRTVLRKYAYAYSQPFPESLTESMPSQREMKPIGKDSEAAKEAYEGIPIHRLTKLNFQKIKTQHQDHL